MNVKYKLLNSLASPPETANTGDAGFDLKATAITYPSEGVGVFIEVCTGLSFEIPSGYVGLVFPRSSISNTKHFLRNSVFFIIHPGKLYVSKKICVFIKKHRTS